MFDSAIDLISLAAPNPVLAFWVCNLIIAILLLGPRPRSSCLDRDSPTMPVVVVDVGYENDKGVHAEHLVSDEIELTDVYGELGIISRPDDDLGGGKGDEDGVLAEHLVNACEKADVIIGCADDLEESDDKEEEDDQSDGEYEDEEEFRRKVEDFIEKMNRGWKAEMLRSSNLV